MAKKKMTKAQAASARKEMTANAAAKKKARENEATMKEARRTAQKENSNSAIFRIIVPIIVIAVIVIFSVVFTMAPGALMGN